MGNNSVPKFIFRLSRFPVYRGSVLGRFYCNWKKINQITFYFALEGPDCGSEDIKKECNVNCFDVFLTVHHSIDFSKYQLSAQLF